jgi:hypothetical protein
MLTRFSNSWNLVKASARVLWADKELVIFPIFSSVGVLVISISFFLPFLFSNMMDTLLTGGTQIFGLLVLFVFYIFQYIVIFFANTALVGAAIIRIRGGDPTVSDGIRIAFSRFGIILGYALIAATVGIIMNALSRKSKGIGRMLISLVGFAWNVATYLVVPVLAIEGVGPIEAIKRSVKLLKQTWGEQIIGNFGLGAIFGLGVLAIIVVFIPLIVLAASLESFPLMAGLIVFLVVVLTLLGLVQSTLEGIYKAAVYQYASTGQAGAFFDEAMVKNAFSQQN